MIDCERIKFKRSERTCDFIINGSPRRIYCIHKFVVFRLGLYHHCAEFCPCIEREKWSIYWHLNFFPNNMLWNSAEMLENGVWCASFIIQRENNEKL